MGSGADSFLRRVRDEAQAEIVRIFGQAWRGGKLDAAYLRGRIPFLVLPTQHDTVLVSIGLNSDTGTQAITFPDAYPATTLVSGASGGTNSLHVASLAGFTPGQTITVTQVSGGTASERLTVSGLDTTLSVLTTTTALTNAYSTGDTVQVIPDITLGSHDVGWVPSCDNVTPTGFDLILARRVSLYATQFGTAADTIPMGSDHKDVTVTFPVDYQTGNIPVVNMNVNNPACRPVIYVVTEHYVVFQVEYVPSTAAGTVGTSTTGLTVDSNTTGLTVDDYNGDTGITDANHHHVTQVHDYTISALATDGQSNEHGHHNDHGHPPTDPGHDHTPTDPGHAHSFTGAAELAPADVDFVLHWTAQGLRSAPAVSKKASWIACGS